MDLLLLELPQQNRSSWFRDVIVWLYRGETDRFISLVQQYLEKTLTEAAGIAAKSADLRTAYDAIKEATAPFLKSLLPSPSGKGAGGEGIAVRDVMKERDDAAKACFRELEELTQRIAMDWKKSKTLPRPLGEGRGEGKIANQRDVFVAERRLNRGHVRIQSSGVAPRRNAV